MYKFTIEYKHGDSTDNTSKTRTAIVYAHNMEAAKLKISEIDRTCKSFGTATIEEIIIEEQ